MGEGAARTGLQITREQRRLRSDPAFNLLCGKSEDMDLRRMASNLGAKAAWRSILAAFGISRDLSMTEEQKNEIGELINAQVETQNA